MKYELRIGGEVFNILLDTVAKGEKMRLICSVISNNKHCVYSAHSIKSIDDDIMLIQQQNSFEIIPVESNENLELKRPKMGLGYIVFTIKGKGAGSWNGVVWDNKECIFNSIDSILMWEQGAYIFYPNNKCETHKFNDVSKISRFENIHSWTMSKTLNVAIVGDDETTVLLAEMLAKHGLFNNAFLMNSKEIVIDANFAEKYKINLSMINGSIKTNETTLTSYQVIFCCVNSPRERWLVAEFANTNNALFICLEFELKKNNAIITLLESCKRCATCAGFDSAVDEHLEKEDWKNRPQQNSPWLKEMGSVLVANLYEEYLKGNIAEFAKLKIENKNGVVSTKDITEMYQIQDDCVFCK